MCGGSCSPLTESAVSTPSSWCWNSGHIHAQPGASTCTQAPYLFATASSSPTGSTAVVDVVPMVAQKKSGTSPAAASAAIPSWSRAGDRARWLSSTVVFRERMLPGRMPAMRQALAYASCVWSDP